MNKLAIALCMAAATLLPAGIAAKGSTASAKSTSKTTTVKKKQSKEQIDSLQLIADMAEKGDDKAQNTVGIWYYKGEHFSQDYKKAVQWWLRSMKQGNTSAMANLAKCYLRGQGVSTDSTRAAGLIKRAIKGGNTTTFEEYAKLADKGDAWSARIIADIYKTGLGKVKKNSDAYMKYLSIAATDGNEETGKELGLAQMNAGRMKEAFATWQKLADKGSGTACFWAGKMLLEGTGVKANKAKGVEYLLRAAEAGRPMAEYYLGRCYSIGDGVTKDEAQAVKWYRLAASRGNHYGQYYLARHLAENYADGNDMSQALHWFERAARQGHKIGFIRLINDTIPDSEFATYVRSMKLINGSDFDGALDQIKKLEKKSKVEGKTLQALVYLNPEYAKHNDKKAINLLKDAAKRGGAMANYLLGQCYLTGVGGKEDVAQAVGYIAKAVELGCPEAMQTMANLYYEGRGVEQNYKDAATLFTQAATMMALDKESRDRLATIYEQGMGGVTADADKARSLRESKDKDILPTLLEKIEIPSNKK